MYVPALFPLRSLSTDHFHIPAGSSPESKPSETAAAAISSILAQLIPDKLSLDAYNAQYLQHNPARADALLAAARVSHALGAPRLEVEDGLFNALNPEVAMSLQVRLALLSLLPRFSHLLRPHYTAASRC